MDEALALTFLSFALTSLLIELTPGPNMTYLAIVSASEGRRAGFATVAGIAVGLATIGLIAAFGVAELVRQSVTIYETLRWAGVAYLLWLAWDGWRGEGEGENPGDGDGRYFRRGLMTNLLNPKAAAFYVSVLPGFVTIDPDIRVQTIALTAIYVTVATVVHAMIVALAGSLEPLLTDPRREQLVRRILSALLAGVALWFAWSTAR